MPDTFPPVKQRPALLRFAAAADTRASYLRRDECGDWVIWGSDGHVHAVPEGYQMMVGCDTVDSGFSKSGWTWAKKRLKFAKVTQNGDEEGSRKHLSEEHLAILKAHGFAGRGNGDLPASGTLGATAIPARKVGG